MNTYDEHQVGVCSEQSSSSDDETTSIQGQQTLPSEEEIRATLHIFNLKCSPILSLQADRQQREEPDTKNKRIPFQDFYED
jgi:hypothetical protein